MSFDQDPYEQANISAADFAMMCDEMKELKQKVSQLESIIADCRDAAGFGTDNDPMNVSGWAALASPEEVPAFIKDQFDRLRNERQWQPMETAPKDGTVIVVGHARQSNFPVKIVFFNKIHKYWSHYGSAELGLERNATHWMPLPEAPKHQD